MKLERFAKPAWIVAALYLGCAPILGCAGYIECVQSSRWISSAVVRLVEHLPDRFTVEYRAFYGQNSGQRLFMECPVTRLADTITVRVPEARCERYTPLLMTRNAGLHEIEPEFGLHARTYGTYPETAETYNKPSQALARVTPADCPIVIQLHRSGRETPFDVAIVAVDSAGRVVVRQPLPPESEVENPEKTTYFIAKPLVQIIEISIAIGVGILFFFGLLFSTG